ncbi:hypothetical protein TRFO_37183 [Tritrichomonas foetus]|uniref:Intimal thickness related receptor IRP domain-containing protein n=1 Tax=Tritrichomonas foetus TaxID=1144522 RepID=A0A1J4JBT4_9EUKA|nr:hypothetical protein TRFO_37183 [Tritrichomonas foetus]|eukprot:OHS96608.1 hypothetical protein TRFO_37183 [Tritrichomonas foetus]
MFSLLFTIVSYRIGVTVHGPYATHTGLQFGFEKGSKYEMKLSNPSSDMVFGLMTKKEVSEYSWFYITGVDQKICHGESSLAKIQTFAGAGNVTVLSGTIPEKGVYTPFYYGCVPTYQFYIEVDFKNGDSNLDYRYKPLLFTNPLFIALFGILLILWLINWFTHFTLEVKIHFLLTACFALAVLLRGLYYGFLNDTKKNGFVSNSVYYSYYAFDIVNTLFILATLLFAASGWCIITKHLQINQMVIPGIFGALFVLGNALNLFLDVGLWNALIGIVTIACLAVYVYYLVKYINDVAFNISAHLYVIKNSGIEPKSTPIYTKYKMFKFYRISLMTFCTMYIICIIIETFFGSILWLPTFAYDFTYFTFYVMLFFIFMMRQRRKNGYLIFEEGEAEEFSQQDLESINQVDLDGGREWDESTPLPPQPMVIGSYVAPYGPNSHSHSNNFDNNRDENDDKTKRNEETGDDEIQISKGTYGNPIKPQDA